MSQIHDWMNDILTAPGSSYRYEHEPEYYGRPEQEHHTLTGNNVLTGHDVAELLGDAAEPAGIYGASERDIISAMASIAYPHGRLARQINRVKSRQFREELREARVVMAGGARDLAQVMRRADDSSTVAFEAAVYDKKLATTEAEAALLDGSPLDLKRLAAKHAALRGESLDGVDDLQIHRKLKGRGLRRRLSRRERVRGYFDELPENVAVGVLDEQVDEMFMRVSTTDRRRHGGVVRLSRHALPLMLAHDDQRGSAQLLQAVRIGERVNQNDIDAVARHKLTAFILQQAHVAQPELDWSRDMTGVPNLNRTEPRVGWSALRMRVFHTSPLLGGLSLLADNPDIAEEGFGRLERSLLDRRSDPSMRRTLVGLAPLVVSVYQQELLDTPRVLLFEASARDAATPEITFPEA